jgi:hypothetical protein
MAKYGPKRGVSVAQSGGRDHTFSGGKGGTKGTRASTAGRVVARTVRNGLKVAVRSPIGDLTMRRATGGVGKPPPILGTARGKLSKIKIQKPVRGGH